MTVEDRCSECGGISYPALNEDCGGCVCTEAEVEQPYRTAAIVIADKPGPTRGFILASKPVPPHKCAPPSIFKRIMFFLTFRRIYKKTLWRCECGRVFIFDHHDRWDENSSLEWKDTTSEEWIRWNSDDNDKEAGLALWMTKGGSK
jgi:hypothetical protein